MSLLLDLLYPPKCVFCGALLRDGERDVCRNCELPETDTVRPVRFTEGCAAPFRYEGTVREAVLRFKFGGRTGYAAPFGRFMAGRLQKCSADFVTWVPVSPLRRFLRGYDQARLLAAETANVLALPCVATLRKEERKKQSKMGSEAARLANIAGAFRVCAPEKVRGARILLIDDICTTGATLSEAALTLRSAGAESVLCGALAVTEETKR